MSAVTRLTTRCQVSTAAHNSLHLLVRTSAISLFIPNPVCFEFITGTASPGPYKTFREPRV